MLFRGAFPPNMPPMLGGILRIPTSNAVLDIGILANKLAIFTYIPIVAADLGSKKVCV